MVTLPLSSSGGRGLENKSEEVKRRSLPVKINGDQDPSWLTVEHCTVSGGEFQPSKGTYVQCTQPYTIAATWPIRRMHTYLDKESLAKLLITLSDLILVALDNVSKWAEDFPTPVANVGTKYDHHLTTYEHDSTSGRSLDTLDQVIRTAVREQRDSLSMVPRSVQRRGTIQRSQPLRA